MAPPISASQLQARLVGAMKGQKFTYRGPDGSVVTVSADVENSALNGLAEAIATAVYAHLKEDVIVDVTVTGETGLGLIR